MGTKPVPSLSKEPGARLSKRPGRRWTPAEGRGACGRARRGRKDNAPGRLDRGSGAPRLRSGPRGQAPARREAGARHSGRSARLGSARLGSALNCNARAARRCQALVRRTGNVLRFPPSEVARAKLAHPRRTKNRLSDGTAGDLMNRHPHRPVLLDADSRASGTRPCSHASRRPEHLTGTTPIKMIDRLQHRSGISGDMPLPAPGRRSSSCLEYYLSAL